MSEHNDEHNDVPNKLLGEIEHLRSLIELMVQNDLSRLELREGDKHILLRRGQPVSLAAPMYASAAAATPPALATVSPSGPPPAAAGGAAVEQELLIRSPMVGTFYAAPDPDAPPLVTVGTAVTPDTVVGVIEAMKVFNEIKADVAGQITRLLVKNGEGVEFDQPLFAVAPT